MNTQLNNGMKMPMVGLGTWKLNGTTLKNALEDAYELGYRHIDTAKVYENEEGIGDFLKNHERSEFFITTKLWNDDHGNVLDAINTSLNKLKVDYVDLYLIHWPVNFNGNFDIHSVWRQMERAVELGKARSIGVSNFGVKNLKELLSFCKIKPVVNQIELHPYLPQNEIKRLCDEHEIKIVSYSSLGSGSSKLMEDPVLNRISQKHSCDVSQVIISFLLSKGILVIPKSKSRAHLKSNITRIMLDESDISQIEDIKVRERYIDPDRFGEHRFD